MMNDLELLYGEWLVEQNLLQAELFELESQLLKELASGEEPPSSPDWSTWCNTLCS